MSRKIYIYHFKIWTYLKHGHETSYPSPKSMGYHYTQHAATQIPSSVAEPSPPTPREARGFGLDAKECNECHEVIECQIGK